MTSMTPIPEEALLAQLETFRGSSYSLHTPSYPSALPGVGVPRSPPNQTNCCAFAEGLIVPTAGRWIPELTWGLARHKQAMIMGMDLYSPITAYVESGIAVEIARDGPPGDWSLVQGWNATETIGHTFIVARHELATDQVLTLEANSAWGLSGVGHRGVGMLNKWPNFDFDARLRDSPWTWERLCEKYPRRAACALLVG